MDFFELGGVILVLVIIFGICGAGIYGLMTLNFIQLDDLNNRTCLMANIPVENCFCEMDVLGNVMCSQKQQSSISISNSTTYIIRS
jgi:hypothetical protein